jgi:hypothetical protein
MNEEPETNAAPTGPLAGARREGDTRRVALVTTTIHVPRFLADVLENAAKYGHVDRLSVIIVGDRKTPSEVERFVEQLDRRFSAQVKYLDLAAQQLLLRRWPSFDLFLRYDCIQRRNVGFLQAALDGAEVVITVDDDNFVTEDDFVGDHLVVGTTLELPVVTHASGWWNVCERLVADPPRRFYHRGFPKSRQDWSTREPEIRNSEVRVIANGGLWLGAPDVDATAHIEEPIHVTGIRPVNGERSWALATGTWCPLNTQNTAFDMSVVPALYLPVMHDWLRGYRVTRMDDIWMSYFLRAIADKRNEVVAYGAPLVRQERNAHSLLSDLSRELGGYRLTESLVGLLDGFHTDAGSYCDCYLELIYHLRDAVEADTSLEVPEREYFRQLTLGMAAWHVAIADVLR